MGGGGRGWVMALASALVLMAGCANDRIEPSRSDAGYAAVARVVLAVIDSGINPYHREFRDEGPDAYRHPSEYLAGYPIEARSLNLTFGEDYESSLAADQRTWGSVEQGQLYWVPGTRIIGLIAFDDHGGAPAGLDTVGHGTMTASRAAGRTTGLAPTAKIVAVQGIVPDSVNWAASQAWIDLQSDSWGVAVPRPAADLIEESRRIHEAFRDAARDQGVFIAAGNGLLDQGRVGGPTPLMVGGSAPGIIAVGGHDNGFITPWSNTMPDVAADACFNPMARYDSVEAIETQAGAVGTSTSVPFVAGAAAELVRWSREQLNDTEIHRGSMVYARGGKMGGAFDDGELSWDEARAALFQTADPTPVATRLDGGLCPPPGPFQRDGTLPITWQEAAGSGAYASMGYGAINEFTLDAAKRWLLGERGEPRVVDDAIHVVIQALRESQDA